MGDGMAEYGSITRWYLRAMERDEQRAAGDPQTPEQLQAMCDAKQAQTDARTTDHIADSGKMIGMAENGGDEGIKPFPQRALEVER